MEKMSSRISKVETGGKARNSIRTFRRKELLPETVIIPDKISMRELGQILSKRMRLAREVVSSQIKSTHHLLDAFRAKHNINSVEKN